MTYIPSAEYLAYLNSLSINELEKLLYKDRWNTNPSISFPNIKRENYQLIREILYKKSIEANRNSDS